MEIVVFRSFPVDQDADFTCATLRFTFPSDKIMGREGYQEAVRLLIRIAEAMGLDHGRCAMGTAFEQEIEL